MRSSSDLETLIRRLAGRDEANGDGPNPTGGERTPQPSAFSGDERQFLEEIRTRTRSLLEEPTANQASPTAPTTTTPKWFADGSSGRRRGKLWLAGLFFGCVVASMIGVLGWLTERSAAARSRSQTALLREEIRANFAALAKSAPNDEDDGGANSPPPDATWEQITRELASIRAKLDTLSRGDLAIPPGDRRLASKAAAGGSPSPKATGANADPTPATLGADVAAIRREIASSEAATTRQIQEMRTVLHELNTVVRRVLNRPQSPTNNNVALPLLAVAVQALINNLQHQSSQVRGEAVEQLVRLGPLARSALPALQQMVTRESDPNIRTAIETAISVISSN